LLEYGLEETGVNLIRAINGEDGVDKCHKNDTIDLVLMDVKMPVMDGYTATGLIKKFRKDLPIIAVTAFAMEKDIEQSKEAGCDDYFTKPIDFDQLLPRLNQHLFKKIPE
jgi:two-component system cell cycle response regulator DivK